jgi:hypothetical protein
MDSAVTFFLAWPIAFIVLLVLFRNQDGDLTGRQLPFYSAALGACIAAGLVAALTH